MRCRPNFMGHQSKTCGSGIFKICVIWSYIACAAFAQSWSLRFSNEYMCSNECSVSSIRRIIMFYSVAELQYIICHLAMHYYLLVRRITITVVLTSFVLGPPIYLSPSMLFWPQRLLRLFFLDGLSYWVTCDSSTASNSDLDQFCNFLPQIF